MSRQFKERKTERGRGERPTRESFPPAHRAALLVGRRRAGEFRVLRQGRQNGAARPSPEAELQGWPGPAAEGLGAGQGAIPPQRPGCGSSVPNPLSLLFVQWRMRPNTGDCFLREVSPQKVRVPALDASLA